MARVKRERLEWLVKQIGDARRVLGEEDRGRHLRLESNSPGDGKTRYHLYDVNDATGACYDAFGVGGCGHAWLGAAACEAGLDAILAGLEAGIRGAARATRREVFVYELMDPPADGDEENGGGPGWRKLNGRD